MSIRHASNICRPSAAPLLIELSTFDSNWPVCLKHSTGREASIDLYSELYSEGVLQAKNSTRASSYKAREGREFSTCNRLEIKDSFGSLKIRVTVAWSMYYCEWDRRCEGRGLESWSVILDVTINVQRSGLQLWAGQLSMPSKFL